MTESERRRPWHRRRPPRRRARSPAGERAAIERPGRGDPLAEPGEQRARLGLLLPRRRRDIRRAVRLVSSPFPFSFLNLVSLFGFNRLGYEVRVRVSLFIFMRRQGGSPSLLSPCSFRFGLIFSFPNRLWEITVCSRVQSEWESGVPFFSSPSDLLLFFFLLFSEFIRIGI